METAAGSSCAHWTGWGKQETHDGTRDSKGSARSRSHTEHVHLLTVKPTIHMHTKHSLFQKNKKNMEAVQTHSHTIAFPSTIQLTRLKKKHKNKLHKYFLPSLFLPPCFLVFHVLLFLFKVCLFVLSCVLQEDLVWCHDLWGRSDRASSLELPRVPVDAASELEGQKGQL